MNAIPGWARVGAKVVCIEAHADIEVGAVYTLSSCRMADGWWGTEPLVTLREVKNPWDQDGEYFLSRFRPLVTQHDDIETHFKALLDVPEQVGA
jgi:hypothetical protein